MRLIFLFIAIALAAAAFVVTLNLTKGPDTANLPVSTPQQVVVKEVPTVNVFIARQDIPIGAVVSRDTVDIQPWPKHLLLPDFVTQDQDIFTAATEVAAKPGDKPQEAPVGSKGQYNDLKKYFVARTPFQKGEVIMRSKLANPNDPSFIAANLPKGMRAVTITADPISGVAGFVFPGDRVDVLITHSVEITPSQVNDNGTVVPGRNEPITEVMLTNVKVIAVNQRATMQGAEGPQLPSSFTLEVSQTDAQKLRLTDLAQARLSVTLRSIEDKEDFELARPTGKGDLSRITPPSYFPVLYENKSSYTPTVVSGDGKIVTKGTGASVSPQTVIPSQTPLANLVKDGINQLSPVSTMNKKVIAVVRGVKMEPVEVQDQ
jgi:pilus assembly protein CpaB